MLGAAEQMHSRMGHCSEDATRKAAAVLVWLVWICVVNSHTLGAEDISAHVESCLMYSFSLAHVVWIPSLFHTSESKAAWWSS